MWQYISVINTAAASYSWENVANYDITFRHLMQFNPSRNWAVTYNQMWNLCMKDPLPKNFSGRGGAANRFVAGGSNNNYQNQGQGNRNGQGRRNGNDYCWSFNKGQSFKFGNKCKFIERCSYCDSGAHGVYQCPKLGKGNHHSNHSKQKRSSGGGDSNK